MRLCPCCEEYGDLWDVIFTNLGDRRAVMCFECDSVWDAEYEEPTTEFTDYETLMKKNGVAPDWKCIVKVRCVGTGKPNT